MGRHGDLLDLAERVLGEYGQGAPPRADLDAGDVGVVGGQVLAQRLGDDARLGVLIEHSLLQADDVGIAAADVLEDRVGLRRAVGLEAEGADVVAEHAQQFALRPEDLGRAGDGEEGEQLR